MSTAQFPEAHLVTISHMCSTLGEQDAWSLINAQAPPAQLHLVESFARHGENARQDVAAHMQSVTAERDAAHQEIAELKAQGLALEETLHHTTAHLAAQSAQPASAIKRRSQVRRYSLPATIALGSAIDQCRGCFEYR
ncbi:hypothetical protein H310_04687 [Aphanomyces invadans]|uniref:Uncharacterized protein n=1 Tax=Aphanomyces invadans TaxID=157072 RepID=A0A024UDF5_9STRA|nr:hypothetical protein H310_04687 [Aphanomyces invadans]ETW04406.1 hypothetical protein H310_04687 [Aphanomyces invadans]|eukprot:XP_008867362.1 hypothetical protein H310_04687 [Aphanomyces invadans]